MLTEERKLHILNKVNTEKSVTVQELTDELGVSESTIRRDITALSREGKLIKVFGGAVALDEPPSSEELSVIVKESINKDEKLRIAKYAASLIMPGDYVFIDSGTTTEYMIDYITEILELPRFQITRHYYLSENDEKWEAVDLLRKADPEEYYIAAKKNYLTNKKKNVIKKLAKKII